MFASDVEGLTLGVEGDGDGVSGAGEPFGCGDGGGQLWRAVLGGEVGAAGAVAEGVVAHEDGDDGRAGAEELCGVGCGAVSEEFEEYVGQELRCAALVVGDATRTGATVGGCEAGPSAPGRGCAVDEGRAGGGRFGVEVPREKTGAVGQASEGERSGVASGLFAFGARGVGLQRGVRGGKCSVVEVVARFSGPTVEAIGIESCGELSQARCCFEKCGFGDVGAVFGQPRTNGVRGGYRDLAGAKCVAHGCEPRINARRFTMHYTPDPDC